MQIYTWNSLSVIFISFLTVYTSKIPKLWYAGDSVYYNLKASYKCMCKTEFIKRIKDIWKM